LSHTLDIVSSVAGRQVNLPILVNILIIVSESKVEFVATNLEMSVKANLRAKIEEAGTFTAPAKTLSDYIHLLTEDQVEISLKENELKVSCGNSSTKIKGTPADEFPILPEVEASHIYLLLGEPFRQALSQTAIAAAKNEIRPELSGVNFSFFTERYRGLVLAATDSYRLAEKKVSVAQGEDGCNCIVPARAAYEMARLLGLEKKNDEIQARVLISNTQLLFQYDNYEFSTRLIDGKYPDYTQIIPAAFKTTATFPLEVMINKIKAASLFTTAGVNAVSFDFNASNNTVGISSMSTQKGEHSSEIDADVTGEENSILLNHRYLLDGLLQMSGDIELLMNSADAPCLIKEKGKEDYLYIIMPIRQ